jgi:hypothetical protein
MANRNLLGMLRRAFNSTNIAKKSLRRLGTCLPLFPDLSRVLSFLKICHEDKCDILDIFNGVISISKLKQFLNLFFNNNLT